MSTYLTLAYVLIALGFILLLAELLLPSGLLAVFALALILVGVTMTFRYGESPTTGLLTLLGVVVALPVGFALLAHYWPKTAIGRRFFLRAPEEDATVASMPVNLELERLRGRYGRAVTPLRPAGTTDFDGRLVDTITEGLLVEPGQWVRCIDVRAGKVVVRPVDQPRLSDLENLDLA